MFHIILFNPEIPPNTGNILRLCANSGATLHLIKPLGFNLNNKNLKRAGLDYDEISNIFLYNTFDECLKKNNILNVYALTKFGSNNFFKKDYKPNDAFIFGNETKGLPKIILDKFSNQNKLRIPMLKESRSLNLSNSVGIILYEAWRQNNFINAKISFQEN